MFWQACGEHPVVTGELPERHRQQDHRSRQRELDRLGEVVGVDEGGGVGHADLAGEAALDDALAALANLEPVRFSYRSERGEDYVGFIAEDVPELVATSDRDGLSTMDIVAVLTRVIQDQQRRIEELEARVAD